MIYDLSISVYVWLIKANALWNKKAKLWVVGRKDWEAKLTKAFRPLKNQPLAWFHCASLGEFEQGRPLIEAFKKAFPAHKILLTFFSPSGFEVRKNYSKADFVCYLPADTRYNAKKFIEITQPNVVFFVKYEFWFNYLSVLQRRQTPAILFSAVFRKEQLFFKTYGGFYRQILFKFSHIFVQNNSSAQLLETINYKNFTVAGDTRFDTVSQLAAAVAAGDIPINTIFEQFKNKQPLFIIGSAWAADMTVLMPIINQFLAQNAMRFIIAPHEINRQEIAQWQSQILSKSICFTEINTATPIKEYTVIIIDNYGLLSSLYQYADYAYIGGAFGKGLHNILEAATFGMPLFFGNKTYAKFNEANDLIKLGGAFPIADSSGFALLINDMMANETSRKKYADICRNYVLQNIGATQQIINWLETQA